MKLIMLGAPGAGKGTQAKKIAEKYTIPHISTGDIFRANIKNGTELGKKAKTFMDQGLLVPDELVVDLVVDRVNQEDCKNGYVLDGFPRTIPQAEALDRALAAMGQKIDYAIDVEVPDENIVNTKSLKYCLWFIIVSQDKLSATLVADAFFCSRSIYDMISSTTINTSSSSRHTVYNILIRNFNIDRIINDVFAAIVQILGE